MRQGLRLLVALILPLSGLIELADTAAFAAMNTTAGSVTARLLAGTIGMSVSVGGGHACVVKTDGTVACWGDNQYGQASPPRGTFKAISAGVYVTCGVKSDSHVSLRTEPK